MGFKMLDKVTAVKNFTLPNFHRLSFKAQEKTLDWIQSEGNRALVACLQEARLVEGKKTSAWCNPNSDFFQAFHPDDVLPDKYHKWLQTLSETGLRQEPTDSDILNAAEELERSGEVENPETRRRANVVLDHAFTPIRIKNQNFLNRLSNIEFMVPMCPYLMAKLYTKSAKLVSFKGSILKANSDKGWSLYPVINFSIPYCLGLQESQKEKILKLLGVKQKLTITDCVNHLNNVAPLMANFLSGCTKDENDKTVESYVGMVKKVLEAIKKG